ncbi:fimbria/pilus outer membrane usher protein [Serratia liquefaciens]|uniref:Fimbrial biogenesis outer membrane usher protein n=1 Tax=Serratia liquefaciens TaxID=614 RepID=A0A515D5R0_SERLI|nr:fimbria/pilus outer membrane usher protein [Serratia liquefaciens]QDL35737.1 fimbrial biogenesis outer membrane usher protein [Serratia liquefaciens]
MAVHLTFRLSVLATALLCSHAQAEALWFPPELVSGVGETADLSRFERGEQLPGTYSVSVYLNQEELGVRDMPFVVADTPEKRAGVTDGTGLMAVLTRQELIAAGVRPEAFGEQRADEDATPQPLSPGSIIPQATTHFDFQQMRLDISIPHKWVQKRPRNWLPPEQWDDGIAAGLLNWSLSGTHAKGRYGDSDSYFMRLNSGVNVGPWRLRDERMLSENRYVSSHNREWRHGRTWLERGITTLRSTLMMGDMTTDGNIFDSTGMRGVALKTEDAMYPDIERGYAPVIRGTALTNARVSIRQNGYSVYETNVAPGDFAIDDINPVYSSGDLEVTVTEADGSIHIFTVPYATLPVLLREGRVSYTLNAGRLHESGRRDARESGLMQGTLAWGLPGGITAYGGTQLTQKYQSAALGVGINMGTWGAASADITHADSTLADDSRHRGQSIRFLYSRGFESTGTTFQLAGYRYSTRGFYTLEESHRSFMRGWRGEEHRDSSGRLLPRPVTDWYDLKDNRRERMEANVSQRLGDRSSLYLSGSRQTYWNGKGASTSLQSGFSSQLGQVSYSLSYSENYSPSLRKTDRGVSLSLSVPLDTLFSGAGKSTYASWVMGHNSNGGMTQQAVLNGTALARDNLNWSLSQSYSRQSGNSDSLRVGYRGTYGDISAGYSQGRDYRQVSYDAAGGIIVHRGGVTAGQPLGNTTALVSVPGGAGVPVESGSGVRTDWRGYAIQPWVSEYRENRIALDVAHLDARTEVEKPVAQVIPTKGAVVKVEFAAKTGLRALMTLTKDGKPLPFGTTVSAGESTGIVGDGGQVFLSGLASKGSLTAQWGRDAGQSCRATWTLGAAETQSPLTRLLAICR